MILIGAELEQALAAITCCCGLTIEWSVLDQIERDCRENQRDAKQYTLHNSRHACISAAVDEYEPDTRMVTSARCPAAPNLILTNPPYVRHHHLDREEKERLQSLAYRMAGVKVNGLAGLYVYFMLVASAWMEDGGYAAWLLPSEFMDVNYGITRKQYLTDRVTLIRAHRFDPEDVQFGDALVSSVVVVFRKAPPPPGHVVEFTFGGKISRPHASDSITLEQLRTSRKWTIYPSRARNDRRTSSVGDEVTLGDLFRVQRGSRQATTNFSWLNAVSPRAAVSRIAIFGPSCPARVS